MKAFSCATAAQIREKRGGSLEPRTAIEGSFSAWGGLGKLDRGLGRGEPFFPDSDSDSDETFQISRKLGLVHVEFFCLLGSQPCVYMPPLQVEQGSLLYIERHLRSKTEKIIGFIVSSDRSAS